MERDNKREQDQRRKSEEERLLERLADRCEWLQPREIFSTGSDMPPEILKLLPKWSREVDQIREIYQYRAENEYAYIDFVFDGLVYRLRPGAVSATYDMFDQLAGQIQEDLRRVGCPYTRYRWIMN